MSQCLESYIMYGMPIVLWCPFIASYGSLDCHKNNHRYMTHQSLISHLFLTTWIYIFCISGEQLTVHDNKKAVILVKWELIENFFSKGVLQTVMRKYLFNIVFCIAWLKISVNIVFLTWTEASSRIKYI